jgi:GINS complex subunit 2
MNIQRPSGMMLNGVSAEENEYLAKEELVTVVSRVNQPRYQFMSGKFGPLEAGVECDVPLWLALHLRKSSRCGIKIPQWLEAESLKQVLENEMTTQGSFQPMPFHYIEIAQLLLTHAWDDFTNPDEVRTLVRDLENIRMDRLRIGALSTATYVSENKEMVPSIALANISALEVVVIRGYLVESLRMFKDLARPVRSAAEAGGSEHVSAGERRSSNKFVRRRFNRDN